MPRLHQEELGKVIGKAQNTVSEVLRLNTLPATIKEDYRTSDNRSVSKSTLIELTRIKDDALRQATWEAMKRGRWTVREARRTKRHEDSSAPDRVVEAGRAFVRRLMATNAIDRHQYQELSALSTLFQQRLEQLCPSDDRGSVIDSRTFESEG